MYHLIYLSTARKLFTDNQLVELLTIAVKHNTLSNVTGFLIYVEGKKPDVGFIFDKILNNNRHYQITVLDRSNVKKETSKLGQWVSNRYDTKN